MQRGSTNEAEVLVAEYITNHWNGPSSIPNHQVFTVWSCYILGNRKYLVGSTLDKRYFEVTWNAVKEEWYIDVYEKADNHVIKAAERGLWPAAPSIVEVNTFRRVIDLDD